LPRFRYDQLMDLGWKRLIPASLAMLMIVAGFVVSWRWGVAAIGASIVLGSLLLRAIDVGREATEAEAASEGRRTGRSGSTGEMLP
jgi:NADH-quinone oxidoreductase subunit H